MPQVTVDVGHTKYPLHINKGGLSECGKHIKNAFPKSKAVIISDENVYPLYGGSVLESLRLAGVEAETIVLSAGEKTKSHDVLIKVYDELVKMGIQKSDVIVALGGGVIGDLSGFAAATYLRGIGFVQIPTTLLAQVDSSVGGKVAVNLDTGKNLVGAFYHPALVVIDTNVLSTLNDEDYAGGMAEAIKTGAIKDALLFELIEQNSSREASTKVIDKIVLRCCEIKADVVRQDELDNGIRMILNFGHTLAHAIEKAPQNIFTHGQAVAIGMVSAARLGESMGITKEGTANRIEDLVKAFNLPYETGADKDILIEIMKRDKKIREGALNLILLTKIGDAIIHKISINKQIGEDIIHRITGSKKADSL